MREKGAAVFIVLIVILIFGGLLAAGYFFFIQPKLQFKKATQLDTTIATKSIIPRTKIEEMGVNVKLIISPSQNDVISGEVVIEAVDLPQETENVGFLIIENINEALSGGPNLGFDTSSKGGWTKTLDTTEYENGEYNIGIAVFGSDTGTNPIGAVNVKVLIDNSSDFTKGSDGTSAPKTKIVESGLNAEIEIAPSKDKVISGEVTITANNVPEETGVVGFLLTENKESLGDEANILGFDSNSNGGWTKTFDTTEFDNGKYYVFVLAAEEVGSQPIGSASVRVEILN